jgi:amidophosphoribosyltransferase
MGGSFGVISKKKCINHLFYGTDYNSHLGTKRAGLVTYNSGTGFQRTIHSIENTYFRSKFEDELDKFDGTAGIGVISDTDAQPILINSHLGRFAIATVAKITNIAQLSQRLLDEGHHFSEMSSNRTNQTELAALLITQGKNFVDGIENVYRLIDGSCSMIILTEDGIIAARDALGRTPIIIGRQDGAWAVSSESTAFPNLDFEPVRDVGPGEIVRISSDGMEQLRKPDEAMQICAFLWVYYGFPTSVYEGLSVERVRANEGINMGRADMETQADSVCGIPDSGVGMALGYAEGRGIPYRRSVLKYTPTWPRSFTPENQERRNLVAKMKLIPNGDMLRGQRIVFCDDSIVRGTQLRDNVRTFYECGAKEVHVRISCPPLVYGCPFIGFTNSRSDMELITRRVIKDLEGDENKNLKKYATTGSPEYNRMVAEIARRLGMDTLKFNSIETLVKSIGLPKCRLCTHCYDGSSFFHKK